MPAIIALILRQVIMSVATGAVVTGAQELLDGTAKELVAEIKDKEGITEKDAMDVVGNIFIDLAINSVSVFTVLKTGAGVKAAEFLGLTSKGFTKKALTGAAAKAATNLTATGGKVVATSLFKKIATFAATPTSAIWLTSALANIIEPGIYKPVQTNALYKKLGIPFQYPVTEGSLKPGPFTVDSFKDYAKGLEEAGIKGILNPIAMQSQLYSRENLADVINYVYGKKVLDGIALSANKLIPFLAEYLIGGNAKSVTSTTGTTATTQATTIATTKVFTGIVSQGVVSQGLTFESRPDDLIESLDELRSAASNNLAPFLQALPGKVIYEVKVVSSITTKDGFVLRGTTQKIQTGTTKAGLPTYKTVTNKFATLLLYVMTDKGTRTKISTIVLGPVDSARLQIQQNDLQALQTELPKLVTTTDISEITSVVSNTPVTTVTPQGATITAVPKIKLGSTQYYTFMTNGVKYFQTLPYAGNVPYEYTQLTKEQYINELNGKLQGMKDFVAKWDTSVMWNIVPKDKTNWDGSHYTGPTYTQGDIDGLIAQIKEIQNGTGIYAPDYRDSSFTKFQAYAPTPSAQYFTEFYFNTLPVSEQNRLKSLYGQYTFELDTAPVVSANAAQSSQTTAGQKPGANATTLFEWYQAQGQTLPNIQTRGSTYEQLGLGQGSYYTGTAEQNTKLLAALKK